MQYSDEEIEQKWQELRPSLGFIINQRKKKKQRIAFMAACLGLIMSSSFAYLFLAKSTIATQNETAEVILPDGSKLTLNHNTTVSLPRFGFGFRRNVNLEGEAFFEVTKDPDHPFEITSSHLITTVLGTKFSITDAPTDVNAAVNVEEGKVRVTSKKTKQKTVLLASEQSQLSNDQLLKSKIHNGNIFCWKTKELIFENSTLAQVAEDLSKYLHTPIVIQNNKLGKKAFTGRFVAASESEIIKTLSFTLDVKITKDNRGLLISK